MRPCKFTFDDEAVFDGFDHESTWNGFDNVAVTKETLEQIKQHFSAECAEEFSEIEPMANGLYSLGWGFATSIVKHYEILQELRANNGACLYWQMSNPAEVLRLVEAGELQMAGDLVIHPDAHELEYGHAYTMEQSQ